ncbi:MAG: phosphate ABC transporter substrate-binding protein PstS family protein, partial [Euryarchaeota archaeon]|nr:phosphate ABC transporter substrate-binding protein PstS family protein [Euryarchaeota archaeon]
MNRTRMKNGLIAVLAMVLLITPVFAQAGNLGYDHIYPALPQKDATPDYLLVNEVDVTIDAGAKEATLQFDTLLATPGAKVYYGLYVPEQEIKVPQYRRSTTEDLAGATENTSHSVAINIGKFEGARYDICNFGEDGGVICYRIELYNPEEASSVFYDGRFRVDGNYTIVPCVIEGPFVDLVTADSAVVSWKTDVPTTATVEINSGSYTDEVSGTSHEIAITGLSPGTEYEYDVRVDGVDDIKTYRFTTEPASPKFEFAIMSDSRAGVGGGERSFAGVNYHKLTRFTIDAYQNGADFVVFSGDLVNGYTTSMDDYRMQLGAWKDATEQVGCYIPIYEVMGNHEALVDVYDDGSSYDIEFDKQDDGVNKSAEVIFAEEFVNPVGGFPDPENTTAPSYAENVYYFDYGNTRVIAFNTNYWWCSHPEDFGGNLEGYVMDNQLAWIGDVLDDARNDSTIEHIFMFAHEPAFPNGGHLHDAQWYNGGESSENEDYYGNPLDRTHVIERRDALWEAISQNGKVVAVLFGDEHNYNRMSVDSETPVYLDGLTNPNFTNPVWQIVTGGAGAPFYAQQDTPWSGDVESFYPSKHYCMISVDGGEVSLKAISDSGEVVDECVLREGVPADAIELTIAGSTTVLPIADACASAYTENNPGSQIYVSGGGSSYGVKAVANGTVDIGTASRDLKDSEIAAYPDLVTHAIARDGVAVIVNPASPVSNLTMEELQGIYTGNITNWADLGGNNSTITVVSREDGSGTRDCFEQAVLKPISGEILDGAAILDSNDAVRTVVAGDENAIGYLSLGYIDSNVSAVCLNGTLPTIENIQSGDYAISRTLLMITNGEPDADEQAFLDFVLSHDGQQIVEEENFISVPVAPTELTIAGSTTVLPIADACASAYTENNPGSQIYVSGGGSSYGVK